MSKDQRTLRKIESGLFAAVFLSVWLCGAFLYQPYQKAKNCKVEIVAHRGASSRFPENTIAAFRGAAEAGADYVELDIRPTKDGILVIMHDSNLLRTAGVDRDICDVTYHDLQSLKVKGEGLPWSRAEAIPTLQEALQLLKASNLKLEIELKPCRGDSFELEAADLILKNQLQDRCLIASCDCGILRRLKSYAPEIKTVYVGCDFENCLLRLQCADAISLDADCVDAAVVQLCHAAAKPLYVWTIDTAQQLDEMLALGVDGVVTDNPALAVRRTYFIEKEPVPSDNSSPAELNPESQNSLAAFQQVFLPLFETSSLSFYPGPEYDGGKGEMRGCSAKSQP